MADFIKNILKWIKPRGIRIQKLPNRGGGDDIVLNFFKEKFEDTWIEQLKNNELCAENEREELKNSFNQIEDGLGDVLADVNAKKSDLVCTLADFDKEKTEQFVDALGYFWDLSVVEK